MNRHKKMAILVCVLITALNIAACGQGKEEESAAGRQESNVQTVESINLEIKGDEAADADKSASNQQESNMQAVESTEDGNDIEEKGKAESISIQDEIAKVEVKSCEYENADWSSMGQQEMNQLTAQWYRLWDDELNSLWSRLSDELDAETKEKVLDEQRAWIKRKEENVKGAGAAAFGGSLQPQLENSTAEEMTRARAYILAGYLADARNESFTIPSEIQESIDRAEPDLDDVFQKFEGQWIFDEARNACVGVERTETCEYGVEGSNWTVWVTGGNIISDLDVYGYTENNIIFRIAHGDYEAFYELFFNPANSLGFAYGTSLYAMDDVIVCD